MSGLFEGNIFHGMGTADEPATPDPDAAGRQAKKEAAPGPLDTLPMSQTMAPAASSSTLPAWLPWVLIGGGTLVAAGLIAAAVSGTRRSPTPNRRRRRRR